MINLSQVGVAGVVLAMLSGHVFADSKWSASGAVSLPPPQTQTDTNNTAPDCSRMPADARCKPKPQHPDYRPQPYPHPYYNRPRPVITNQLPAQPAIEINSLGDDWEGCRKAKLGSIRARNSGSADEANNLDEWLWKNCRSYSYELRQLEQDDM